MSEKKNRFSNRLLFTCLKGQDVLSSFTSILMAKILNIQNVHNVQ
jgi:hypothetical protein